MAREWLQTGINFVHTTADYARMDVHRLADGDWTWQYLPLRKARVNAPQHFIDADHAKADAELYLDDPQYYNHLNQVDIDMRKDGY